METGDSPEAQGLAWTTGGEQQLRGQPGLHSGEQKESLSQTMRKVKTHKEGCPLTSIHMKYVNTCIQHSLIKQIKTHQRLKS